MKFCCLILALITSPLFADHPRDWTGRPRHRPDTTPNIEPHTEPEIDREPPLCRCGCNRQGCTCGRGPRTAESASDWLESLTIEFDDENLKAAASMIESAAVPQSPRVQWEVWFLPDCPPCKQDEKDFRTWFERGGYEVSQAPTAKLRLMDFGQHQELVKHRRITQAPTYVLTVDGREVERFEYREFTDTRGRSIKQVAYPGRAYLARRLVEESRTLKPLTTAAVSSLSGGTLNYERDVVDVAVWGVKTFGGFQLTNEKPISATIAGVPCTIPAKCAAIGSLVTDGARVDFKPPPSARLAGLVSVNVEAIEATSSKIVIVLPGWQPDLIFSNRSKPACALPGQSAPER